MGVYEDGVYGVGAGGGGSSSVLTLSGQTTGTTPTALTTDGTGTTNSTNIPTLADDTTLALTVSLIGIKPDGSLNGHWEFKVTASRDGTVSLDNVAITEYYNDLGVTVDSSWIQIDAVNFGVYVQVTGVAATTIDWVATYPWTVVSLATAPQSASDLVNTVTWSSGATIDCSTGNIFTLSVGTTGTLALSNVPSGQRYFMELHLNWTAGALTFPASWSKGDDVTALTTGDYVITAVTVDGGASFKVAVLAE